MRHLLPPALKKFGSFRRGILLHHWDADGIAGAALIEQYFEEQGFRSTLARYTPPIGNYFLTKEDIKWMKSKKPDFIITVDICLHPADVQLLKSVSKRIVVIDHHYQALHRGVVQVNPVAYGKPTNDALSVTWVINEALWPYEVQPLGILGMVGDQQEDIRFFKRYFPFVQQIAQKQKCTWHDFLQVTQRLHAIYVTNHRSEVIRAVSVVREHQGHLKRILKNQKYLGYQKKITKEVQRLLRMKPVYADTVYKIFQLSSPYHLIAEVTRHYAARYPRHVIVTIMPHPQDRMNASLYFRTKRTDIDMRAIVELARRRKLNAGGKIEVAGVSIPTNKADRFIKEAQQVLGM